MAHDSPPDVSTLLGDDYAMPVLSHYTSLQQNEIRLLRIHPGCKEDSVQCSLLVVDLDDTAYEYAALSYVWGPEVPSKYIMCNGLPYRIRQNLYDVISNFRHPDDSVWLWADAICINQQDLVERGSQVQLMSKLYSCATRTIVWLGKEDSQNVHAAFSYLTSLVRANTQELMKLVEDLGAELLTGMEQYFGSCSYNWRSEEVSLHSNYEGNYSSTYHSNEVGNLAVAKLFRNDYFRRGWVIQEVVMGKKGYVHWGEGSIYSGVLSLAARLVITLEYRKLMDDEVAWTGVNNWFMMEQLRTRARDYPFIRCLQLARKNIFTDPLDRVYGLLAMAFSEDRGPQDKDYVHIEPVYGIPVLQCYQEVARQFLPKHNFWEILVSVQHAHDIAPDWPSWVPDWRICTNRTDILQHLHIDADWTYSLERSKEMRMTQSDSQCLRLRGLRVATISSTAGKNFWREDDTALRVLLLSLVGLHMFVEVAWAATAGHSSKMKFGMRPVNALDWLLYHKMTDWEIHAMNALAFVYAISAEEALEFCRSSWKDWTSETCADVSASSFAALVRQTLTGRCFFHTLEGYLGVASDVTQPKDWVVVFQGCPYPFILRPLTCGRWKLIGECLADEDQGAIQEAIKTKLEVGEEQDFCIC
jgi:hypothetical protein